MSKQKTLIIKFKVNLRNPWNIPFGTTKQDGNEPLQLPRAVKVMLGMWNVPSIFNWILSKRLTGFTDPKWGFNYQTLGFHHQRSGINHQKRGFVELRRNWGVSGNGLYTLKTTQSYWKRMRFQATESLRERLQEVQLMRKDAMQNWRMQWAQLETRAIWKHKDTGTPC